MQEKISEMILEYLQNVDSPTANVVEHIIVDKKATENVALVGDAIYSLLERKAIVISGVCPNRFYYRGLDIRIRRASDFQHIPRSAC